MTNFQFLQSQIRKSLPFALISGLLLYTLGLIVLLPVAGIIINSMYGATFEEFTLIVSGQLDVHPQGAQIFRIIQGVHQLVTWGLGGVVMTMLMGIFPEILAGRKGFSLGAIVLSVLIIFLSIPLVQTIQLQPDITFLPVGVNQWLSELHQQDIMSQRTLMQVLDYHHTGGLILNLCIFAILPAVCEELFFRGFLQNRLSLDLNPHLAIWISAMIFSFVHFQFLAFFSRMVLAALLGYFFYVTGNLLASMIAHFFYNFLMIILTWMSTSNGLTESGFVNGTEELPWTVVLLSLVSTGILLAIFFRLYGTPPKDSPTIYE